MQFDSALARMLSMVSLDGDVAYSLVGVSLKGEEDGEADEHGRDGGEGPER